MSQIKGPPQSATLATPTLDNTNETGGAGEVGALTELQATLPSDGVDATGAPSGADVARSVGAPRTPATKLDPELISGAQAFAGALEELLEELDTGGGFHRGLAESAMRSGSRPTSPEEDPMEAFQQRLFELTAKMFEATTANEKELSEKYARIHEKAELLKELSHEIRDDEQEVGVVLKHFPSGHHEAEGAITEQNAATELMAAKERAVDSIEQLLDRGGSTTLPTLIR